MLFLVMVHSFTIVLQVILLTGYVETILPKYSIYDFIISEFNLSRWIVPSIDPLDGIQKLFW